MQTEDVRNVLIAWLQRFPRLVAGSIIENRLVERGDTTAIRFFCGTHLYEVRGSPHNVVATAYPLTPDGTPQATGTEIFSGPLDEEELVKLTAAIVNAEVVPFSELKSQQREAVKVG